MFPEALIKQSAEFLSGCRDKGWKVSTAESCTGGMISGILTEIPGSSDVFDRGFVTYSNDAKMELLGIPGKTLDDYGAVSEQTATAMARGALDRSRANLTVAVTGVAGPGGGTADKPVGLVHMAAYREDGAFLQKVCQFGDIGRSNVRLATVKEALNLMTELLK